jgi:hypothetical protein
VKREGSYIVLVHDDDLETVPLYPNGLEQKFPNCGAALGGALCPLWGASVLCEGNAHFEQIYGHKVKYIFFG